MVPSFGRYESWQLPLWNLTLWQVLWLIFGLSWGTSHLLSSRNIRSSFPLIQFYNPQNVNFPSDDEIWTFGQYLALFLLAPTLLSASQLFTSMDLYILLEHHLITPFYVFNGWKALESLEPSSVTSSERQLEDGESNRTAQPTCLPRSRFHENDFMEFFWFRLFLGSAIALVIAFITGNLVFFAIDPNDPTDWIGEAYKYAVPNAVVYMELYFAPCCILEKYLGCGRYQSPCKPSLVVCILIWLWTCALLAAGILLIISQSGFLLLQSYASDWIRRFKGALEVVWIFQVLQTFRRSWLWA